jgi:hypothetical protein
MDPKEKLPSPDLEFIVLSAPAPGGAGTVRIRMIEPTSRYFGDFTGGSFCGDGLKTAGLFVGQRFKLVRIDPAPNPTAASAAPPVSDDPTGR